MFIKKRNKREVKILKGEKKKPWIKEIYITRIFLNTQKKRKRKKEKTRKSNFIKKKMKENK